MEELSESTGDQGSAVNQLRFFKALWDVFAVTASMFVTPVMLLHFDFSEPLLYNYYLFFNQEITVTLE